MPGPEQANPGAVTRDERSLIEPLLPAGGRFDPGAICLRLGSMLRIQGYRSPERVPRSIWEVAERMALRAQSAFAPTIWYRVVPLRYVDGCTLFVGRTRVVAGTEPTAALSGCVAAVVFLLTMGARLDKEVERSAAEGGLLDALFLETAGWLGIEAATKVFAGWVRRHARERGYALTRRLAPGYGSWPLSGQQPLFALFEDVTLTIRLLESCAMTPNFSRSGLYGLTQRQPLGAGRTDIMHESGSTQ